MSSVNSHWSCEFLFRPCQVYSVQHYVIKFVSGLRHVDGFLRLLSRVNQWLCLCDMVIKLINPLYIYNCSEYFYFSNRKTPEIFNISVESILNISHKHSHWFTRDNVTRKRDTEMGRFYRHWMESQFKFSLLTSSEFDLFLFSTNWLNKRQISIYRIVCSQ
jgi:hypothetical protein